MPNVIISFKADVLPSLYPINEKSLLLIIILKFHYSIMTYHSRIKIFYIKYNIHDCGNEKIKKSFGESREKNKRNQTP